jgi:hypothetical protein
MWRRNHAGLCLILPFSLLALFLSACSKSSSSAESAAPQSVSLGAVELAYDVASRQDLGNDRVCVLTARSLDRGNIELLAVLEKGGKSIGSTRVLPAKIGAPLQLSFGNVQVQLTPQIKQ